MAPTQRIGSVHIHYHGPWDQPRCSPSLTVQAEDHWGPLYSELLITTVSRASMYCLVHPFCEARAVCSPTTPAERTVSIPTSVMVAVLPLFHSHLHKMPSSPILSQSEGRRRSNSQEHDDTPSVPIPWPVPWPGREWMLRRQQRHNQLVAMKARELRQRKKEKEMLSKGQNNYYVWL